MTSLIFDQDGRNLNSGNSNNQNLNLGSLLQNLVGGSNPLNPQNISVNQNNINTNTNQPQNSGNSEENPSPPTNTYPILDETNRNISNLQNLVNQMNGNLLNGEIPQIPNLNYPVNILTTFGNTLKNYHNNLMRFLPYVNNLSDLLQRESLITNPTDRQNANKLAKNVLTGIREISNSNKMIDQFLVGLEFGNRPSGGMVTFIQGSINQIQLVGEAVDQNNNNSTSFNINIQENPNNLNLNTQSFNLTNLNPIVNIGTNSNLTTSPVVSQENTQKKEEDKKEIEKKKEETNNVSRPIAPAGGNNLNNLLGSLMGSLGNPSAVGQNRPNAEGSARPNPMGNLSSIMGNLMSNPQTSGMVNNLLGELSQPGGTNNMMNMFSSLMGGANAGNQNPGGNNVNSMLNMFMNNMGGNVEDEEEGAFQINPEIKNLVKI